MSGRYVPRSLREKNKKPRPSAAAKTVETEGAVKTAPKPSPRPRPSPNRPKGASAPRPRTRPGLNRRRTVADLRRLALRLTATAVLVLLVAGSAFYFLARERAVDDAVSAAKADAMVAVQAIIAYDYRSFDSSKANGMAHVTGAFADDYAKQMDSLRDQAVKEKAVVVAPVSEVGVVGVDHGGVFSFEPKSVDVLLFVNQIRRNDNVQGEKVDTNRIVLHMVRADGMWKAASVTAY